MRKSFATELAVLCALLAAFAARADDPPAAGPTPAPAPPAAVAPAPAVAPRGPAVPRPPDRLDLDATSIRGNQELPKVLYIVPWKEAGLAEPGGRPLNSLVDEALAPVDREVFRRQMRYFDQLYQRPVSEGVAAPASQDE